MTSAALSPGYLAAREHAGLLRRTRGLILVSGRDRASYLQGLLTNDIAALASGQGCYAAYLTAQGRMISDLYVYELGDVILLVTPLATKEVVLAKLDQFIFSEDVQLGDLTDAFTELAVVGPGAATLLAAVTGVPADALAPEAEHGAARHSVDGEPVVAVRVADTGAPGFDLIAERAVVDALWAQLLGAGAEAIDDATAEALRIEAGVPLFGPDMDTDTIPLEAGIEQRAISFSKGCYVGQEVIIRVLHRGQGRVARKLVGLLFESGQAAPPAGTALQVEGAVVGAVTSSVESPALGRPIALGYLKRDLIEPGTRVATPTGAVAEVVTLPFRA